MICEVCRQAADSRKHRLHQQCKGKTHCTCGHRKIKDNGQGKAKRENSKGTPAK